MCLSTVGPALGLQPLLEPCSALQSRPLQRRNPAHILGSAKKPLLHGGVSPVSPIPPQEE